MTSHAAVVARGMGHAVVSGMRKHRIWMRRQEVHIAEKSTMREISSQSTYNW